MKDRLGAFSQMLHHSAALAQAESDAREVQSAESYAHMVRRLIVLVVCGGVIIVSAVIPLIVWR